MTKPLGALFTVPFLFSLLSAIPKCAQCVSYVNRDLHQTECQGELLHRELLCTPQLLPKCEQILYPEMKNAVVYKNAIIITGVLVKDRKTNQESVMKIVGGGVGHSFVHIAICSLPKKGFSYEIRVVGCLKVENPQENPLFINGYHRGFA